MNSIQPVLDRVLAGERMSVDECTTLLESHDIARMGAAADEIRARRFAADGIVQGDEIAVNVVTARNQNAPSVAMDRAGNFVVVWQTLIEDSFEIRARRFAAEPLDDLFDAWLDRPALPSLPRTY